MIRHAAAQVHVLRPANCGYCCLHAHARASEHQSGRSGGWTASCNGPEVGAVKHPPAGFNRLCPRCYRRALSPFARTTPGRACVTRTKQGRQAPGRAGLFLWSDWCGNPVTWPLYHSFATIGTDCCGSVCIHHDSHLCQTVAELSPYEAGAHRCWTSAGCRP